ncbi:hypothetical protein C8A01DRAFT_49152 [Parachaetomium inaequale]|uniref:Uncharacterized protein n=1 Tax=Parachaetomium inaequale TaxID=2588326 RepID=A0AAN6PDS3_9PEZI|nr:hypothetical protein C8A01DRAFT_49152 [Parachaetomium inaequale]
MAWKHSGLYGPGESLISAQPQSRLATYWLWCIKCTESEDGQGKIRLFLESSEPGVLQSYLDDKEDSNFSGTRGRAGSGLAVTSRRDASSEAWLVLFFDAGEKLGMMTRKSATDSAWVLDEAFSGATHPTFPGQQIVAGTFDVDYANGTHMEEMVTLAVQLEKDGSLAATWWDPRTQTWTFGSPVELKEGPQPPPAFTAIAMLNRNFYGMADGTVLEYSVGKETVNRFVFTGKPVTR